MLKKSTLYWKIGSCVHVTQNIVMFSVLTETKPNGDRGPITRLIQKSHHISTFFVYQGRIQLIQLIQLKKI